MLCRCIGWTSPHPAFLLHSRSHPAQAAAALAVSDRSMQPACFHPALEEPPLLMRAAFIPAEFPVSLLLPTGPACEQLLIITVRTTTCKSLLPGRRHRPFKHLALSHSEPNKQTNQPTKKRANWQGLPPPGQFLLLLKSLHHLSQPYKVPHWRECFFQLAPVLTLWLTSHRSQQFWNWISKQKHGRGVT